MLCGERWYVSTERAATCTNSNSFPSEWDRDGVRDLIFHDSPEGCCEDVFRIAGKCDIVNACDPAAQLDGGGECLYKTFHMSTEVLNACTNDYNYPDAWNEEENASKYLFTTWQVCCLTMYPRQQCDVIDICPTPPPTVSVI